jgi:hypothetical protein
MQRPDHTRFHLPAPSGLPIVTGFGIALTLFGFVPDARLYRFSIVSVGLIITVAALWRWLIDALAEYRDLPD